MIFDERVVCATGILKRFMQEKKIKVSYPLAIEIIASGMGVRKETARIYLDRMLLVDKEIKTNYWEIWFEE